MDLAREREGNIGLEIERGENVNMKIKRGDELGNDRDREETIGMEKEGGKKIGIDREYSLNWHENRDNKHGTDMQVDDKTGAEREKRQQISMDRKSKLGTEISICMRPETQADTLTKSKTGSQIPIHLEPETQAARIHADSRPVTPIPILLRSTDQVGSKSRTLPKPSPSGKGKLMVVKLDKHGMALSGLHTNPHTNSLASMSEFSSHSFPNLQECSRMLNTSKNNNPAPC